ASHVADLPGMAALILTTAEFDAAGPRPERPPIKTSADLVARLDSAVAQSRQALAGKSDVELLGPLTFKLSETVMVALPRVAALRTVCLSHHINHRGQLTVYMRLLDVPLPSLYGPTADESV